MLTQALRGKEFYSRQASVSPRQSLKEQQLAETWRLQRRRYAQTLVEALIEHFGLDEDEAGRLLGRFSDWRATRTQNNHWKLIHATGHFASRSPADWRRTEEYRCEDPSSIEVVNVDHSIPGRQRFLL
jgi:hypothetical protein